MLKLHTNYGFYELFLKLNEHATLFIPREKRKEKNFLQDKTESTPPPPSLFNGGSCDSFFSFPCSIVDHFVLFLLAIVLSVLRFKDSSYPGGIFKFFYCLTKKPNTHIIIMVDTPEAC